MVEAGRPDEWKVIEGMLPNRWRDAASCPASAVRDGPGAGALLAFFSRGERRRAAAEGDTGASPNVGTINEHEPHR